MKQSPISRIFTSNRLEMLAEKLAENIGRQKRKVFEPVWIITQTPGMGQWLSRQIARQNEIFFNFRFIQPSEIVDRLWKIVFPDNHSPSPWRQTAMQWTINHLFQNDFLHQEPFRAIANYVHHDPLHSFQLAGKLADLFDQYHIYRETMIEKWEKGQYQYSSLQDSNELWQAEIWRKLAERYGSDHPVRRKQQLLAAVESPDSRIIQSVPAPLYIFGLIILPEYYFNFFQKLKDSIPIHAYLLNPCRHYWLDIIKEKKYYQLQARQPTTVNMVADLHYEISNPLLANWGKVGLNFFRRFPEIFASDLHEDLIDDTQEDSPSLLHQIQQDILDMRELPQEPVQVPEVDNSIYIVDAYTPARELEALRDQVLGWLNHDSTLSISDILVLTPELKSYLPYINAVFKEIPFSMADRSIRDKNSLSSIILQLLDLATSRFSAETLLQIIENEWISHKFNFTETDLETLRQWIEECGIRWGIDGIFRQTFNGQQPLRETTWEAGLDLLINGLLIMTTPGNIQDEPLRYPHIDIADTDLFNRLIDIWEKLKTLYHELQHPLELHAWSDYLKSMLECFLPLDTCDRRDVSDIQRIFHSLRLDEELCHLSLTVSVKIIREYLIKHLDSSAADSGFSRGDLLFTGMVPMRSIPYRIICLIGMNDNAYPRPTIQIPFDLIASHPMANDRIPREHDRYLFLETLLSARETLYISYLGHNPNDNSEIFPSLLVREFVDYIDRRFRLPNTAHDDSSEKNKKISEFLRISHPLHNFNPIYVDAASPRHQTYNVQYQHLARQIAEGSIISRSLDFFQPLIVEDYKEILDIEELHQFFKNPAAYFCGKILNARFPAVEESIKESEPFEIDSLNQHIIKKQLMELPDVPPEKFRGAAQLPLSHYGESLFAQSKEQVQVIRSAIEALPVWHETEPVDLQKQFENYILRAAGQIYKRRDNAGYTLIEYHFSENIGKKITRLWIAQNILAWLLQTPVDGRLIYSQNKTPFKLNTLSIEECTPVSAVPVISNFVKIFEQGRRQPLFFLPGTSWNFYHEFSNNIQKGRHHDEAEFHALSLAFSTSCKTLPEFLRDPFWSMIFTDQPLEEQIKTWQENPESTPWIHQFVATAHTFFNDIQVTV